MSDGSVSAITAVIFIYSACLFLAVLMYKAVEKLLPEKLKSLGFDFTKTCFICAYPFGHGILWKYYGGIGFLCGLIPIVLLTNLLLPKGNPTPVSVWIQHFRGLLSLRSCLHRTALHLSAALAAYRLGILLFRTGLHEHFITKIKDHESGFCNSALNVSVSQGLFIETVGILYEAWFSTLKLSDDGFTDALLKITNTGLVVVSGFYCTGMFMHPPKATALTFGCGQTPVYAHLIVYWLGPLLGAWLFTRLTSSEKSSTLVSQDKKVN